MSTQYDAIAVDYSNIYNNLQNTPAFQFEEANKRAAVSPYIQGKRVLDLACGSGHYSRRFLDWGATSVIGVDISHEMVKQARKEAAERGMTDETKLCFVVGDGANDTNTGGPLDLSAHGAPFDVVAGTWFLNYAPDAAGMTAMWTTISQNLKQPDGVFIGLTIPPLYGNRDDINRALRCEWAKYGTSRHVKAEVHDDQGFEVHIVLGFPGSTQVEFDNYYLRNEVFEKTARNSGMAGGLEWLPVVLSPELIEKHPRGFWNDAVLSPHCRICVAWRS